MLSLAKLTKLVLVRNVQEIATLVIYFHHAGFCGKYNRKLDSSSLGRASDEKKAFFTSVRVLGKNLWAHYTGVCLLPFTHPLGLLQMDILYRKVHSHFGLP